jgi:hypothetical protein
VGKGARKWKKVPFSDPAAIPKASIGLVAR